MVRFVAVEINATESNGGLSGGGGLMSNRFFLVVLASSDFSKWFW